MHGSRIEYIVQIRVQDYWLDYGDSVFSVEFRYRRDAEAHLAEAKKNKPYSDFKLVKRTHTFVDELIQHDT